MTCSRHTEIVMNLVHIVTTSVELQERDGDRPQTTHKIEEKRAGSNKNKTCLTE